jgi:hypothetical protein
VLPLSAAEEEKCQGHADCYADYNADYYAGDCAAGQAAIGVGGGGVAEARA